MSDHKAEAMRLTETVTRAYNTSALPADTVIALAQVHATLALADQQRIANLITFNPIDPKYKSWDANNPPADLYVNDAQIREGLGL